MVRSVRGFVKFKINRRRRGRPTAHDSYTVERESLGWWYVVEGSSRAGKAAKVVGCTLVSTLTSPSTLALDDVVPKVGANEADRGGSRYKIAVVERMKQPYGLMNSPETDCTLYTGLIELTALYTGS